MPSFLVSKSSTPSDLVRQGYVRDCKKGSHAFEPLYLRVYHRVSGKKTFHWIPQDLKPVSSSIDQLEVVDFLANDAIISNGPGSLVPVQSLLIRTKVDKSSHIGFGIIIDVPIHHSARA
jgi:hypothetical protein